MGRAVKKFQMDDWVSYIAFPDSDLEILKRSRPAVILEVLEEESYYDYRIFIDGEGTIKNVREDFLFPLEKDKVKTT